MSPEPCPSDWQEIALALYSQLRQERGQWVAVRVQETLWEVVRPRSQEAILAACETTSQSDEALVEELARAIDAARKPNDSLYDYARAILPILHRERADAFDDGVRSTFEQRARDLADVAASARREGIEKATEVVRANIKRFGSETEVLSDLRALAEKRHD